MAKITDPQILNAVKIRSDYLNCTLVRIGSYWKSLKGNDKEFMRMTLDILDATDWEIVETDEEKVKRLTNELNDLKEELDVVVSNYADAKRSEDILYKELVYKNEQLDAANKELGLHQEDINNAIINTMSQERGAYLTWNNHPCAVARIGLARWEDEAQRRINLAKANLGVK
jgi:DNA repair exonuclease SbcCD ATPase subunit